VQHVKRYVGAMVVAIEEDLLPLLVVRHDPHLP
jgi:hypothetical protein